jgi:hypothetical protein
VQTRARLILTSALVLLPALAFAQTQATVDAAVSAANAAQGIDPGTVAVGWIVAHQTLAASLITLFGGRLVVELISAGMKKFGVTKDSPGMSLIVPVLRAIAIDLTPPPQVVLANATAIVSKPAAVAATPEVAAARETLATAVAAPQPIAAPAPAPQA